MLGRIADVDLCAESAANAGACGAGSRIGTVTVGAGPGTNPFFITDGRAYVTGPYGGAPFGLSIVVHAKAGPFDLGEVVVRAAIHVDRATAVLRVASDPLPTILAGIPLQVRVVNVAIDRPGFTFNPTSCAELQATAHLESTGGRTSEKRARFQVAGCAGLPFKPRLSLRVGRKGHTRARSSTPLVATLRMPPGQANLAGVKVVLPRTLNALLPVVDRACALADFQGGRCEQARRRERRGGDAAAAPSAARLDVLRQAPSGGLPNLMIALRGQVAFDLTGRIAIPDSGRLGADFGPSPTSRSRRSCCASSTAATAARRRERAVQEPASRRATARSSSGRRAARCVRRSQRVRVGGLEKAGR